MFMMEDETADSISLRDLYYTLFKHKVSIFIIIFTMLFTVFGGLYVWPETYEARAKLFVKLGRENVSMPTAPPSSQQRVLTTGLTKEDINSEIMMLTNRFMIEKVVKKLGTDFLFPKSTKPQTLFKRIKYELGRIVIKLRNFIFEILYRINFKKRLSPYENAVLGIQKNFSAMQSMDSDVIELQLRWSNPHIAEVVLDTLINFYFEYHLETHKIDGEHEFFQRQVEIIRNKLKDSEDKLKLLKQTAGITSYEEQSKFLLQQTTNLDASLKNTQTETAASINKINELKKQMSSLMEAIKPGANVIYKEAERNLLLEEVNIKSLNAKTETQKQQIESYLKDLERLNQYDIELKRLKRQIQIDEGNYSLYQKVLEEARISTMLDNEKIVNIKVIDPAAGSFTPVKPRKILIFSLGAALSLFMGIGFSFLSEYFDHSIKTAEDVKRYLNLPVLATVRKTKKSKFSV